jgi:Lrp/AsnC family transcriptional regulator, leucine-responsive regulatory protein
VEDGAADEVPVPAAHASIVAPPGLRVKRAIEGVPRSSPSNRGNLSGVTADRKAIDALDRRILEELQTDARLPIAELARRVSLSAPAVAERIQRLERAAVITGYHARVDPRSIGYPIAAVVRVAPTTGRLDRIRELARELPEVVECHRITGEDCFFLKLHLKSLDELEPLLDRFTPHGRTTTSLIHSSPVENRPLPLA